MTTLTKDDMPRFTPETLELENGITLTVETEHDSFYGAPWEENDGHGPVSQWTSREKRPGERVLSSDGHSKRYYDFAGAVKEARRDGWDTAPYHAAFPNETKSQQAERAAEADFEYCKGWCDDRWSYVGVIVTAKDSRGKEIGRDSLWGIETLGDYWREVAAEMANEIFAAHIKEGAERAEWEARDTITV